jgi:sugar/nucleoside kinase (ribokinase family)
MLSSTNSHEMESRAMFDLLVIGDANPDVILSGVPRRPAYGQREELVDTGLLTVGGSGAIMACGAARLGLRTAFVGRVGDDEAGRFMLSSLKARGVDVSACVVDPSLPTALTVVLVDGGGARHESRGERRRPAGERGGADGDAREERSGEGAGEPSGESGGDRAILTAPGCLPYLSGADVPRALLASARHVHAASFFLQPRLAADLPSLFSLARSHGATTSLDTNDDPSGRWDGLEEVLAETDELQPNEAEVLAIAGRFAEGTSSARVSSPRVSSPRASSDGSAVEAAARDLAARGVLPVVKLGRDGVLAWTDAGAVRAPAVAVTPVDTVGAGDSLDAGFVAARLRGHPPAAALRIAAACGSLSTRAAGGTAAQASWEEAVSAASVPSP